MSKQKPWSEIVRKAADERIARMTDCDLCQDGTRIRELEEERDEAYARGVRDGIDRIRLLLEDLLEVSTN